MKYDYLLIAAVVAVFLFLTPVASAETLTGAQTNILKGPEGILVPLGIGLAIGNTAARFWYNWICVGLIMGMAAVSSKRNNGVYGVFIPILAGILMLFGWLNTPNPAQTFSIVIMCGLMGAAVYMKDRLHEYFGVAGPGNLFMNLVIFMVVLQAVVGMVNSGALWGENYGVAGNQWQNVDVQTQVASMSSSMTGSVVDMATAVLNIGFAAARIFISMVVSLAVFSVVLIGVFPIIKASPLALAFVGVLQIGIWILYAKFFYDSFWVRSVETSQF